MIALYIILALVGLIILLFSVVLGPSYLKYSRKKAENKMNFSTLDSMVHFIEEQPQIDGIIDNNLRQTLPPRSFNFDLKWPIFLKPINANYRLAYGSNFLYLYIEVDSDQLVIRDRGYQFGDGFQLLLSVPKSNNDLTDQFYVFGFSPQTDPEKIWAKKVIWYHDKKVALARLGDDVEFEVNQHNGKIGLELALPWKEVYPYHPWISDGIGFNLGLVKAVGGSGMDYKMVVWDWRMMMEQQQRKYALMDFDVPENNQRQFTYLIMDRNIEKGKNLAAKIANLSAQNTKATEEKLIIEIKSLNEEITINQEIMIPINDKLSKSNIEISTKDLLQGSYVVYWKTSSSQGQIDLNIIPEFDFEEAEIKIKSIEGKISQESINSIKFKLQQIKKQVIRIKPNKLYPDLTNSMVEFKEILQDAENGEDSLANKTGHLRRAFLSEIDSTLQPYSVRIPENYTVETKYPLIVFLHGSGRSEDDILHTHHYICENEYIQIAPRARGVSNFYGSKEAQIDIQEAIDDAIKNYSIDPDQIILTGFSMGGYGVYRTYLESPDRFKALAVLSGNTKPPFVYTIRKGSFPNILKKKNYQKFGDVPMFVFHGEQDRNCPFKKTAELVEKIKLSNENIEILFDKNAGHNAPNDENAEVFKKWLDRVVSS